MSNSTVAGDAGAKRNAWRRVRPTRREVWGVALVGVAALAYWWGTGGWRQFIGYVTGDPSLEFYFHGVAQWTVEVILIVLSIALLAGGLLLLAWSLTVRIRQGVWRRICHGIVLLGSAAALIFVAIVAYFGLLAIGIAGDYVLVEADDGQSVLVTQDGFDGDMVGIHTEQHPFHYGRAHSADELSGFPRVRDRGCTLSSESELLILTCGPDVVEIDPR